MEKGKWVVRGASLALILGFFMPAVLVSCSSSLVEAKQPFSLADIADLEQLSQSILYLLPIMAVVAVVLTFLPGETPSQKAIYLWGQLVAISVGLITAISSLSSLNDQVTSNSYGLFKATPSIGAFILLGGAIAFGVGWFMQKQDMENSTSGRGYIPEPLVNPVPISPYHENLPPSQAGYSPGSSSSVGDSYLELLAGDLPFRRITLQTDNLSIGRSKDNYLHLPDPAVSRVHAVLRNSEGIWFLQDQDSSGGTFVNGSQTEAIRLNEGDEVEIGSFRFRFHSGRS